jgi:hypothetical protein
MFGLRFANTAGKFAKVCRTPAIARDTGYPLEIFSEVSVKPCMRVTQKTERKISKYFWRTEVRSY